MPAAKTNKRAKTEKANSDAKVKPKGKGKTVSKVPAHRSRLVGRLADLMTMPVDVFTEICFHLFPIDLLHLAWSSKRLRSLLMSKTAKSIWRTARENQLPKLPPCPEDLSEPQYIALLFTTICQKCGANRAQRTSFVIRTRLCATCYPKYVGTMDAIFNERFEPLGHIFKIVDSLPGDLLGRYNLEQLEVHTARYSSFDKEADRNKYVMACTANARKVEKHAEKVESWMAAQSRIRAEEKNTISQARWEAIKRKLDGLGWEKSDYPSKYNSEWTKLTQKRQALTDKVWKNLYPKLEPMLKASKAARLEREKSIRLLSRDNCIRDLYVAYQNKKKQEHLFFPEYALILTFPSIKSLRDDDDAGDVTAERWEACVPELEATLREATDKVIQEVRTWYSSCVAPKTAESAAKKTKTTKKGKLSTSNTSSPNMSLVTAAFKCRQCQEALWLPTFFQHDHFISQYVWPSDATEVVAELDEDHLGPGCLVFDAKLQNTVSKLIATVGWNPCTATVQEAVMAHTERYACDRCDDKHQQPVSFGKIVSHYMAENSWYESYIKDGRSKSTNPNSHNIEPDRKKRVPTTAFRLLSRQTAVKMRADYESEISFYDGKRHMTGYRYNEHWGGFLTDSRYCNMCHYTASGKDAICHMVHHLKAKHDITINTAELDEVSFDDEDSSDSSDGYQFFNPFGFGHFDPYAESDEEDYDSDEVLFW